jgi:hypothetical protein
VLFYPPDPGSGIKHPGAATLSRSTGNHRITRYFVGASMLINYRYRHARVACQMFFFQYKKWRTQEEDTLARNYRMHRAQLLFVL